MAAGVFVCQTPAVRECVPRTPLPCTPCHVCSVVDEVVWVKLTVNRRLAKSHGYYLQHAKEVCLVGVKRCSACGAPGATGAAVDHMGPSCSECGGADAWRRRGRWPAGSDVILSERRGQSQKPEEIYELIEALVPGGALVLVLVLVLGCLRSLLQGPDVACNAGSGCQIIEWSQSCPLSLRLPTIIGCAPGRYLEVFARKNNLRNFWVSLGNEVTGTGLPEPPGEILPLIEAA